MPDPNPTPVGSDPTQDDDDRLTVVRAADPGEDGDDGGGDGEQSDPGGDSDPHPPLPKPGTAA